MLNSGWPGWVRCVSCWAQRCVTAVMSQFLHMDPDSLASFYLISKVSGQEKVSERAFYSPCDLFRFHCSHLLHRAGPDASRWIIKQHAFKRNHFTLPLPLSLSLSILPASRRPRDELLTSRTSWCHFTTLSLPPSLRWAAAAVSHFHVFFILIWFSVPISAFHPPSISFIPLRSSLLNKEINFELIRSELHWMVTDYRCSRSCYKAFCLTERRERSRASSCDPEGDLWALIQNCCIMGS